MPEQIRVAVLGAGGRMGRVAVKAASEALDMRVVGACGLSRAGLLLSDVTGVPGLEFAIEGDFDRMLRDSKPDVIVDFAKPYALARTSAAMDRGVTPVIGATGQTAEELAGIEALAEETGVAAMVIPNFAVGAALMMRFAAEAARYMPEVEIAELHYDKKLDSPSGTAVKTAKMIDTSRDVRTHSVRLPGLVAHQEVIFGGDGQVLTIRHDSLDVTSYVPGILLALRRASSVRGLIYGLDKLF